jgi:ABC-type molybdate transport system permease subunit
MVAGQLIDHTETASIHVINSYYAGHDAEASNTALVTTIVGVVLLYVANKLLKRFGGTHV